MSTSRDFAGEHPRETIQLVLLGFCLVWQGAVAFTGLLVYAIFSQALKWKWWQLLIVAISILLLHYAIAGKLFESLSLINAYMRNGFRLNKEFWLLLLHGEILKSGLFLIRHEFIHVMAFGFALATCLSLSDEWFASAHDAEMIALQKGALTIRQEKKPHIIARALSRLSDAGIDGTLLGVSTLTAKPVVVPDQYLNQILLVLGTTGGGKTITMRRFYQRAIRQGYPLLIVDGKPTDANVAWVEDLARLNGRSFHGFNCGNLAHYDPLANGGYTELKDKIITLKDEWSSDYYRSIAEDYLQTTFEVLLKSGKSFDLAEVAGYLSYENLCIRVRETRDTVLMERVETLAQYDRKEITGLQAHLHILLHSELGNYFTRDETTFDLGSIIAGNGVAYFALPALRFPSFAKVLGKLVANDLKAAIDRVSAGSKKIFASFDEYSVFAGEQSLNLANMGREKGLHVIFGTQGLADLEKIDPSFSRQITNCANTIICHRLNDHAGAEMIAQWAGTKRDFRVTAQINPAQQGRGPGSVRETREFVIHPDSIKQDLATGEAFFISKVEGFHFDKIKVRFH